MGVLADGTLDVGAGLTMPSGVVVGGPQLEASTATPTEDAVVFADATLETSSSQAYLTKISGTCPALAGGTYKITTAYKWTYDSATSDFRSRLTWDGSPLTSRLNGETHRQEPKDPAGDVEGTGTDQVYSYVDVSVVTVAPDATPSVLLEWSSTASGVDASIWDAVVIVERIGA